MIGKNQADGFKNLKKFIEKRYKKKKWFFSILYYLKIKHIIFFIKN